MYDLHRWWWRTRKCIAAKPTLSTCFNYDDDDDEDDDGEEDDEYDGGGGGGSLTGSLIIEVGSECAPGYSISPIQGHRPGYTIPLCTTLS